MRRTLKMSGLNTVSELPEPDIRMKPIITTAIPTASRMKFILSKAKSFLSIPILVFFIYSVP